MTIQIDVLYSLLVPVARRKGWITYTELSNEYLAETGEWYEPHGSWDGPLGELNNRLDESQLPPLSSVVILQATREPGGGFWGSCPGVPQRPPNNVDRIALYSNLLRQVHDATWTDELS